MLHHFTTLYQGEFFTFFLRVRCWEFSSQFSQVEGAKDEIVCWDLYSLELLTKLDLTTALPGAPLVPLDPGRKHGTKSEHCWTRHQFYHGFTMDNLSWIYHGLLYWNPYMELMKDAIQISIQDKSCEGFSNRTRTRSHAIPLERTMNEHSPASH